MRETPERRTELDECVRTYTLVELRPGQCRWPEGEQAPYSFCGAPQVSGSYCAEHHKRAVSSASLRPLNFAPRQLET